MKKLQIRSVFLLSILLAGFQLPLAASEVITFEQDSQLCNWRVELQKSANDYKISVSGQVAKNCYLYRENTSIAILLADKNKITLPHRKSSDANYERFESGTHLWQGSFKERPAKVLIDFQGCTTGGESGDMCLMPETIIWDCAAPAGQDSTNAPAENNLSAMPEKLAQALEKFPQQHTISGLLTQQELIAFMQGSHGSKSDKPKSENSFSGFWAILLMVLLGGLSLNLTPCVLPMIPINLAIIGAGAGVSRWQGFRRGMAYALGITLAYGVLGLLAALTGSSFGSLNSSSIFNWMIAIIFIVLALGMLGVYELDFTRLSNIFRGKSKFKLPPILSTFLLGVMAALLAGACVAPVVITVVVLAGKLYSEGAVWALGLPFALGLSMALPWPLLGAGLSILPKPGAWMVRVKQFLGVLIMLMALYYGYLGWKIYRNTAKQPEELTKLAAELTEADRRGESVLIDCWATWCKNCAEMERLLQTPEVRKAAEESNIKIIKFQAENINDPAVKAFMKKYALPGLPSLVLLKKD